MPHLSLLIAQLLAVKTIDLPHSVNEQALITWTAGEVACGGEAVAPLSLPKPLSSMGLRSAAGAPPVRYSFAIDASGRVTGIRPETPGFVAHGGDVVPSLAAARFPAGRARSDCTIGYERRAVPIVEADPDALIEYTIFPAARPPQAVWDRIKPAGSDCLERPPPPLSRAFPDFGRIPQAPGTLSWVLIGHDIDAAGRPIRIKRVAGSGNDVLEREAIRAVGRSTFVAGARRGCLYPYWRRGGLLPAPDAPALSSYTVPGSTCPTDLPWVRPPRLSYPEPFRRRGVEGWAVVAYDVAPWGEIGNLRVLDAQPASTFGDAALAVLRAASKQRSERGATRCVDRVRFVTAPEGAGRVGAEGPIPPPE